MRTAVVAALLGLGAFAVATGLVLQLHTHPFLAKLQHDIDTVTVSEGEGVTAVVYPPGGLPEIRHNLRLRATTHVEGDLAAPEIKEGGDVTVWKRSTIVKEDADDLVLSAEVRRICIDRRTGEAVAPCHGEFYETEQGKRMPPEGEQLLHPGLNFVFPFNTEQRDYRWYDTVLKQPVAIHFAGEQLLQGLDMYRFVHTVPPTEIGRFEVPGADGRRARGLGAGHAVLRRHPHVAGRARRPARCSRCARTSSRSCAPRHRTRAREPTRSTESCS